MHDLEELAAVAYLLPIDGVVVETIRVEQQSGWTARGGWERVNERTARQWFDRREPEVPNWTPPARRHALGYAVSEDRHSAHVGAHVEAGWVLAGDRPREDALHTVLWYSPRLEAIRVGELVTDASLVPPPVPGQGRPRYYDPTPGVELPAERPPLSEGVTGVSHARHAAPRQPTWTSTAQSGMRAGAFAAFLDWVTDGGFFDF